MEQINDPAITETPAPQYPDWQKMIRRGQVYCNQLIEQGRRDWLEMEALEEMRLGLLLAEAMSYFGIVVAPPLENRVVLDRIVFSITPRGKAKELLNAAADALHFDLSVAYQLDGDYERERERLDEYSMFTSIAVRHRLADDDWQQEHGQLADKIDEVTQVAQRFMAQVDGWKAASVPIATPPPTLEQQLISIVREIVRDELKKQIVIDEGYED